MTSLTKPVRRVTRTTLGPFYGPDRGKKLVITLNPSIGTGVDYTLGETIEFRLQGTQRVESMLVEDFYQYAIECRVNTERLAKKAKKHKEI